MKDKKVVFMGTPKFSLNVLESLIENCNVIGVVTQPDKEVGRKKEIKTDVGVINGKYFLNIACVGIDAEVANNVPLMKKKNIKVKNLYTASILYTFTHFKFKEIFFKSKEIEERNSFTILSICNGRYYGGGYNIAPGASLEDGTFEVYYTKNANYYKSTFKIKKRKT